MERRKFVKNFSIAAIGSFFMESCSVLKKVDQIIDTEAELEKEKRLFHDDLENLFNSDYSKKIINVKGYSNEKEVDDVFGLYLEILSNFLLEAKIKYKKLNIAFSHSDKSRQLQSLIKEELFRFDVALFYDAPIRIGERLMPNILFFKYREEKISNRNMSVNSEIKEFFEEDFKKPMVNIVERLFAKTPFTVSPGVHNYKNGNSTIYLNHGDYEEYFKTTDVAIIDDFFNKNNKEKDNFEEKYIFRNEFGHAEFKCINLKDIEYNINFLGAEIVFTRMQIEEAWSNASTMLASKNDIYHLGATLLRKLSPGVQGINNYRLANILLNRICYQKNLLSLNGDSSINIKNVIKEIEDMDYKMLNIIRKDYVKEMISIIRQAKEQSNSHK